jgi:hypothetical protein
MDDDQLVGCVTWLAVGIICAVFWYFVINGFLGL